MPLLVTSDISSVLQHLVKALKPFAKQQQVGLSFHSLQKRLVVSYDPEELASEVLTRICRGISCAKKDDSVIVQANIYKQSQKSYLKITLQIKARKPIKNSKFTIEKKQALLNGIDHEITIIDLPMGVRQSPSPIIQTKPDISPSPPGFLPSFYSSMRIHLQSHFTKADNLVALLSVNHPKQAAFLQKVQASIVDNIEDEDFDVNSLSLAMRMSRAQLFRRLKPLIRQAPASYIRSIRLTMAKELLETTDLRVGEVASKTGFKSQSHFTQSFIKKYGVRPSVFSRSNKNATKK